MSSGDADTPKSGPKRLARRHHYLPQMYLRGFADEADLVWVFDRQNNTHLHQGVVNTAVKKDFYTILGPDGQKSDAVEQMMANMVEGPMTNIIERLDKKNVTLEAKDREILALFVALLRTRNLAFDRDENELTDQLNRWWAKATHSSVEAVEKSLRDYEQKSGEDMTDISPERIFEIIRDDQYKISNSRQNNIKIMMSLAVDIAKMIFRLQWKVFAAPKGMSFLTCDNPFTVVPPPLSDQSIQGYGVLTPGASTIVPLSSKTAICFSGAPDRIRGGVIYKDLLRDANGLVAANSERFVIARDEALLRSVVRKGKLDQWQAGSRFKMNAPDPYAPRRPESAEDPSSDEES